MSDDEVRSLVRLLAAEPNETRHKSHLVLRLDSALKHAGLLGDATRLPQLGVILRDAGLTKRENDGMDVDGKPWLGRRFFEYVEPGERARVRAKAEEELRRVGLNEDEADRSWLREVVLEPEDLVQPWMHWEPPVVGALVQRHWDTKRTEARYDVPSRVTARPRIVVGARCDTLVSPKSHCSSCCCFELSWCLGDWIVDEYWQTDEAIEPVHGCGQVDGIVQGIEAPHCLRPYRRARIPTELVRPSVLEAYLALNPEGAPV